MIDLKFWKNKPSRHNNPSYSSKLVQQSLFVQSFQNIRFIAKSTTSLTQKFANPTLNPQNNSPKKALSQNLSIFTSVKPVKPAQPTVPESQKQILDKITPKLPLSSPKQPNKIKQKLHSNIKALASEFNDFIVSSNNIYQQQQKPFDIIKGTLKNHKSQINLFPKFRLERMDNDYKKRQAFIKGDLQKIKNLEEKSRSEVRFFSNRKNQSEGVDFRLERIKLRRREPIEIAFKITQNAQIIRKKLLLEK